MSNVAALAGNRFSRYELRTTEVNAARAFYADVFGAPLWGSDVSLAPLPERAAARGAAAHWLGQIGTRDVEGTAGRIVALGGQPLGPMQRDADGSLQANTAGLPHIHPHWLFHFRVADIAESLARVRAGGGKALGPIQTSSGDLVAPCDDPQGAAFALYQFTNQTR